MQKSDTLPFARAPVRDDRTGRNRIRASLRGIARAGAKKYQRGDLTRLIGLWPHEIADRSLPGTAALLVKIRAAIRAERRKGLAGHWTYDLDRHLGLLGAYRAELTRLRFLERIEARKALAPQRGGKGCSERPRLPSLPNGEGGRLSAGRVGTSS